MNLASGPPAPPLELYSPSVYQILRSPNPPPISLSLFLSFSVGSHKDTNAGQSDPKQMRKEDPIVEEFWRNHSFKRNTNQTISD